MNEETTTIGDLAPLIRSWKLHLPAANLAPRTIRSYPDAATRLGAAGRQGGRDADGAVRGGPDA